eukprot:UN3016
MATYELRWAWPQATPTRAIPMFRCPVTLLVHALALTACPIANQFLSVFLASSLVVILLAGVVWIQRPSTARSSASRR